MCCWLCCCVLWCVVVCCCVLLCVVVCCCVLLVLVVGLDPPHPTPDPPTPPFRQTPLRRTPLRRTDQNFALFFPLPLPFRSFSLSLWCLLVEFGCSPGFHTTTRELQTCTFEGPGASNTTKIQQEDTRERQKARNGDGRGEKKREILDLPPFGATLWGATMTPRSKIGLVKIGLAKVGFGQNWPGQNQDGQKWIGPNWPNQDGQNGIGQSRSLPGPCRKIRYLMPTGQSQKRALP